jgi:hypothetical protein
MLPHNKETLSKVGQYIGHPAIIAVNDDLRTTVSKLTEMLIIEENERTVVIIQGAIRALNELVDRYTKLPVVR